MTPKTAEARMNGRSKSSTRETKIDQTLASVKLTHPDKLLWSDEKVTKRNLAEYYDAVQEWMLPHVTDRPLALVRCPEGMGQKCFFQRNWSETLPAAIGKAEVGDGKKKEQHVTVHDLSGIISLVQIGVLEIHTWNCTVGGCPAPGSIDLRSRSGAGCSVEADRRWGEETE